MIFNNPEASKVARASFLKNVFEKSIFEKSVFWEEYRWHTLNNSNRRVRYGYPLFQYIFFIFQVVARRQKSETLGTYNCM